MAISKEALEELRKLYKEETGKEMSPDVALEAGTWLLKRVRAVAQSVPREKAHIFEEIKEEQSKIRSCSPPPSSPEGK
jgi:hypothetical protein